jgi:F-box/leucine-rich repeat protein 10/11
MKGSELNVDWLVNDPTAMTEPVIVEEKTGLGMKLPDPSITVKDVAEAVGADMPVEVIGTS